MGGKLREFQPTRAKGFRAIPGSAQVSDVHMFRMSLTAANLIAMFTTPVSVLPTPGTSNNYGVTSDSRYLVSQVYLKFTPGTVAFTGGGTLNLQYHTTTASIPHAGTIPASLITATANSAAVVYALGPNTGTNGLIVPAEGIDITNASGVFAAGNGTAELVVLYRSIKL